MDAKLADKVHQTLSAMEQTPEKGSVIFLFPLSN